MLIDVQQSKASVEPVQRQRLRSAEVADGSSEESEIQGNTTEEVEPEVAFFDISGEIKTVITEDLIAKQAALTHLLVILCLTITTSSRS